jgi:hypothetical protein
MGAGLAGGVTYEGSTSIRNAVVVCSGVVESITMSIHLVQFANTCDSQNFFESACVRLTFPTYD